MRRVIGILLILCLLAGLAAVPVFGAGEKPTQEKKTIAIVFDNSGSMYMQRNTAWAHAIYSMEVFASMLNDGDKLLIYPMGDIETDSGTYSMSRPLEITSSDQKSVSTINSIHSPDPPGTPIEAITAAYNGLQRESGSKWLVVLTDGYKFHDENLNEMSVQDTKDALNRKLGSYMGEMNVLYLGIGSNSSLPGLSETDVPYKYREKRAANSTDILNILTGMCNLIFGRDELPGSHISGDRLSFSVSMNKVFVFVQGEGISGISLQDESGRQIQASSSEIRLDAPQGGAERDGRDFALDNSLGGAILTFTDVPQGTYTLSSGGSRKSAAIYYEPNVDIAPVLINPNGKVVEVKDDLVPGEYTMTYGLRDGVTGEPADMSLLGNAFYTLDFTYNGEQKHIEGSDGQEKFMLQDQDQLQLDGLTAEYLNGYRISKDGKDFGFPWDLMPITIEYLAAGSLEIRFTGGPTEYHLSQFDAEEPFLAEFWYDGTRLTGSAFDAVQWDAGMDGGGFELQKKAGDDRVEIRILDPGNPEQAGTGDFSFTVSASYQPPDTAVASASASRSFSVTSIPAKEMEVQLTGGQEVYHLSELETEEPYEMEVLYGGETLKGDELKNLQLEYRIIDGNLQLKWEVEKDHLVLRLAYPDPADPTKTDTGRFTLSVTATYAPPFTEPAMADGEADFEVENDVTSLKAKLVPPKTTFTRSELGDSIFYVNLTMGGEPLTQGEMSQLSWEITMQTEDGENSVPVEVEKDPENSRLVLRPQSEDVSTGTYSLKVRTVTKDQLGADAISRDEAEITVQLLPTWLVVLIWLLALLLLAALIWFILSRKILPKRIFVTDTFFMVDGEEITGSASAKFNDGGKKTGRLSISSPSSPTNPLATCNFSMNLEASDTRFKVLRCKLKRNMGALTAMRTKLTVRQGITSVSMCGAKNRWEEGKPVLNPGEEENPRVLLSNESRVTVQAEVMDEYGGSVDLSLSFVLHFQ